jgi:alpha/beta superfamily hydrolase
MPEIVINGPVGRLEARYHHNPDPRSPIALVLHPHPQHGGTMNNRVTYTMFQAFVSMGFSVLRFNYRGVGRSQGKYDRGEGELADATAALDWLQTYHPNAGSAWIGGFSFGAWISMQLLMRRPDLEGFVVAAPPASLYDFSFLAPCPCPGLILHGDLDELVPEQSVAKLADKLAKQRGLTMDYRIVYGADHFFQNHAQTVNDHIVEHVSAALEMDMVAAVAE